MIIAGPGRTGPYPVHDLLTPAAAPAHDDPAAPHAELRARACRAALALPRDSPQRATIEYLVWRVRTPEGAWLHARLADIIRPRALGAFA